VTNSDTVQCRMRYSLHPNTQLAEVGGVPDDPFGSDLYLTKSYTLRS